MAFDTDIADKHAKPHGSLAAYAASGRQSRGRRFAEPGPVGRGEFQRDRDRIIHSSAFRRLEYKTQVFINHEGDLFRTRLTHSLEVAQIARSIARSLNLNEDLAEAIALAHDLGHTPFGHAGQEALNACMTEYGGFEHNRQSLRVVDDLERRYAEFDGLNLCFETREGILKHCSPTAAHELGELGQRFLNGEQPSLEAQLTNIADEIAYNNHDVDDGLRSGHLCIAQLQALDLFAAHYDTVYRHYGQLDGRRLVHETIRRMINHLVTDLVEHSRQQLAAAAPADIAAVRTQKQPLIGFSAEVARANRELKQFLHKQLYHHYRVQRMTTKSKRLLQELFEAFWQTPKLLPDSHFAATRKLEDQLGPPGRARGIADYIAGMTDRFAITEHRRLFNPDEVA